MSVKRSHMVARSYLEPWANSRNVLYVWDLERTNHGRRSLGDATVVSYAYRTEHTTLDLEADYGRIESDGVPAVRNLASAGTLTDEGREALVRFMDMHLERGRYADQASVKVPIAVGNFATGGAEMSEMSLGDRLVLSRSINKDALRLADLGVLKWRWRIAASVPPYLVTGDGSVLLFERRTGSGVCTVTFPLSPSKLLIMGEDLPQASLQGVNEMTLLKSRRWWVDQVEGAYARQMPSD